MEADTQWLKKFDRDVFQAHMKMADCLGDRSELQSRYEFHVALQPILITARQEENRLRNIYLYLSSKESSLSSEDFKHIKAGLIEAHSNVAAAIKDAGGIMLPALENIKEGAPLRDFILQEPLVAPLGDESKIDGAWFSSMGRQTSTIEDRCSRLYNKSMGAILKRQEAIASHFKEQYGGLTQTES